MFSNGLVVCLWFFFFFFISNIPFFFSSLCYVLLSVNFLITELEVLELISGTVGVVVGISLGIFWWLE